MPVSGKLRPEHDHSQQMNKPRHCFCLIFPAQTFVSAVLRARHSVAAFFAAATAN
jgi:hypothetical protein